MDSAGPISMWPRWSITCRRSPLWPHHQVAILGKPRSSPRSARQMAGRKASRARVSTMPEPSALTITAAPLRSASARPGVPMREFGAEFQRVGKGGVHAPPEHVNRFQSGNGPHQQTPVGDRQIAALEQHEAEVARDVGVLEIGFVVLAGRQDRHLPQRLPAEVEQPVAEIAKEAGEPVHVHVAVDVRQRPHGARPGSPARSRRPREPAPDRPAPTTVRPARGRDRRRGNAENARLPAGCRPSGGGIQDCAATSWGGSSPRATRRFSS